MCALRVHEKGVDSIIFSIIFSQFFLALHMVAKMQGYIRVVLTATCTFRLPNSYNTGINV